MRKIFLAIVLVAMTCVNSNATVMVRTSQGYPANVCVPSDTNANCQGSGGGNISGALTSGKA